MSRFGHDAPASQSSCLPLPQGLGVCEEASACFLGTWLVQGDVGQGPKETLTFTLLALDSICPGGKCSVSVVIFVSMTWAS